MKKKKILIAVLLTLVMITAGCGGKNKVDKEVSGNVSENESVIENETVTENEKVTEETQKNDNKKDNTTTNTETKKDNSTANKNESTSNKNETTTKPSTGNTDSNKKPSTGSTTKPSTGSTNNNSGSTNNSANAGFTGSAGSTGNTSNNNSGTTTQPSTPVHEHKWTEVVEEEIHYYAWRTICGKCKTDLTDMTDDELTWHTVAECHSGYSTHYIEVDFVTENIVKTPVVTGYKCECGAEK